MAKEVQIEALRPFNRNPQGDPCEIGDVFAVDAVRADELQRLGLARPSPSERAAPPVENKMAPTPRGKRS